MLVKRQALEAANLAASVAAELAKDDLVSSAGPGFINRMLAPAARAVGGY